MSRVRVEKTYQMFIEEVRRSTESSGDGTMDTKRLKRRNAWRDVTRTIHNPQPLRTLFTRINERGMIEAFLT